MLSVIFAIAGGYAALALTGGTLTVYAQLGLVMLIGLTAKNAILMVEYANVKRREGLGVARSAIEGAKARFRAVMMTAWSFLVGVLPLVFSSGAGCESRQAIGLVTFAGMLVATLVGIAFPPAYFALFSRKGQGAFSGVETTTGGCSSSRSAFAEVQEPATLACGTSCQLSRRR